MLTPESVEALQAPISEAAPAGPHLEGDLAFTAMETAAQGKPERQYGDKLFPAEEPEWSEVATLAEAMLGKTKDVRPAMLALRAATRVQGVAGFSLGMQLLTGLLDRYWDVAHPMLDVEDNNDATKRINALAPLATASMVLRDFHEASVGVARGVGPIKVRDIAIAHNLLKPTGTGGYTPAQVHGALVEIHTANPATLPTLAGIPEQVVRLQKLLEERTGSAGTVDLAPLKRLGAALHTASTAIIGTAAPPGAGGPDGTTTGTDAGTGVPAAAPVAPPGEIGSREDAMRALDKVIAFLEKTEPGNPAPLLIERAKRLIGVSFFDIMADLAPGAIDAITNVTGKKKPPA